MTDEQRWPDSLWIVRHGESAGNVARNAAIAARLHKIDLAHRDVDVPLSARGEEQAVALGQWFAQLPPEQRPTVIYTSPYVRAYRTAALIAETAKLDIETRAFVIDERLREKEFGVLDRLTSYGIAEQYPDQAEFRQLLGKFYHRPPGGESWCDVILRLRGVIDTITRDYRRERVLMTCHTVVVLCLRYLLEQLTETEILDIDRQNEIANCSITSYRFDPALGKHGAMALQFFNVVAPLIAGGAEVTAQPDAQVGPR